eukprot:15406005-Alexandrium_andersonii.AAC.1
MRPAPRSALPGPLMPSRASRAQSALEPQRTESGWRARRSETCSTSSTPGAPGPCAGGGS